MRDVTKVIKIAVASIKIGYSATENEPSEANGEYVELGLIYDEQCKINLSQVSNRDISGATIQFGYNVMFETGAMQVKDISSLQTNYQNKNCWIKISTISGEEYKFKNIIMNLELLGEFYSTGKSVIKLTAQKYVMNVTDVLVLPDTGAVSSLTLIEPNGGEILEVGEIFTIRWSSVLIDNVKIEYTINGGTDWVQIIASTPDDGEYNWTVSGSASSNCKVKISKVGDPTVYDISDSTFTIIIA